MTKNEWDETKKIVEKMKSSGQPNIILVKPLSIEATTSVPTSKLVT